MKKNLRKTRKLSSLAINRLEDREAPLNTAIQSDGGGAATINALNFVGAGTYYQSVTDGNGDESGGGGVRLDWVNNGNSQGAGAPVGEVALDAPPEFMAAGASYSANACYSANNFYAISACIA